MTWIADEAAEADEIAKEELVTSIDAALSSSNNSSLSALTSERTEATIDFTKRVSQSKLLTRRSSHCRNQNTRDAHRLVSQ